MSSAGDRSEREGVVKYRCEHVRRPLEPHPALGDLVRWRAVLCERRLIGVDEAGTGYGNVSVRLHATPRFLVSGSQTGGLGAVDGRHFAEVLVVDLERNFLRCAGEIAASSEAMTHAALYQADPAIGGVAHVHAPAIWRRGLGILPTTREEAAYGTPEMAHEMIRLRRRGAFRQRGAVVMGGHRDGVIAFGPTLGDAVAEILRLARDEDTP
jgi:ribulose-5-phosphate 4-epimerase/fuculose-1-phosphate aldolase